MKKLVIATVFTLSSLFIFNVSKANAVTIDDYIPYSSEPINYTVNILEDTDRGMYIEQIRLAKDQNNTNFNTLTDANQEIYIKHNLLPYVLEIEIHNLTDAELYTFDDFFGAQTAIFIYENSIEIDNVIYEFTTPIDFYIVINYKITDIIDSDSGYDDGYQFGLIVGREEGRLEGYTEGFRNSETYWKGRFLAEMDDTLKDEYNKGFDKGYEDGKIYGLSLGQEDAYNEGYDKGANESFLGNFDKWIVPAIIVVMFVGGFFAIVRMKRDNL